MSWNRKKFIATAIDPIHIGTGGERLGRVDLSVVREPITEIPKIPGTTLSGALKFFLDLKLRDEQVKTDICASTRGSRLKHAWQKCPVCYSFGYTPQTQGGGGVADSAQGILQFSDARLILFPVSSACGPIWITTKPRLKDFLNLGDGLDDGGETWLEPEGGKVISPFPEGRLNLGWLLLDRGEGRVPAVAELVQAGLEERFAERAVIVSEWLFSNLVNNNMEVRTSVVIDPETGAASSQGLFTYEAVVRNAVFGFDIIENDYRGGWSETLWPEGFAAPKTATAMLELFSFPGIEQVGLGGMTTRGFGRLQIDPLRVGGEPV